MNRFTSSLVIFILLALAFSSLASATTITVFSSTITSSDPTQLGRLSRSGIPQDWSGSRSYPGDINVSTVYSYHAYLLPTAMFDFGSGGYAGYVQIIIDSVSTATFGSAYANSYQPTNKATNWLGDAGSSGNFFGTDPEFFQVFLPQGDDLVIVMNTTAGAGVGIGDPFTITVEGFTDTEYTDPVAAVPEPASLVLMGSGIFALAKRLRKRW